MSNKPSRRYDIEEFIEAKIKNVSKTVVIDDNRITHNHADYWPSLVALDRQLAEIEYNREGIETPSLAEWAAEQIAWGSRECSPPVGTPKRHAAVLRAAWKKFTE